MVLVAPGAALIAAVVLLFQLQIHAGGGLLQRVGEDRFISPAFREGPAADISPILTAQAGRRIWKLQPEAEFHYFRTGIEETFIAPTRRLTRKFSGNAFLLDGTAFWEWRAFFVRAGAGKAWTRIPAEIPIEDTQSFATYGVGHRRGRWRIEVRNFQFWKMPPPLGLGAHNVAATLSFCLPGPAGC